MKGFKTSAALTLILFISGLHAPAQTSQKDKAIARYDERGNMVSLYNLNTQEARERCARFVYVGIITGAEYDNERLLVTFSIRRKNHHIESFNLVDTRFESADREKVSTLMKVGNRVRVVAYGCGASAAVLEADEVKALGN